jgi:hypothetical protein
LPVARFNRNRDRAIRRSHLEIPAMHRSAESPAAQNHAVSSRRHFLQTGSLALGGIAAAGLFPNTSFGGQSVQRGKSVIFVYLAGGPSHLDMYDLKPNAPVEIRGEFRPISTSVPGMRICEQLPLHARIADKLAIVNGVETIDTHSDAVIASGYLPQEQRLSFAEVTARVQGSGFWVQKEFSDPVAQVRNALALAESGIPAVMVTLGANCLPGGDWDTHGKVLSRKLSIFDELKEKLPAYDHAIYRLVTDLHRRGLNEDVLVVACGEFGRTPWINRHGGRDHWAPCGSVLFAGGGLRTGQVVGDTGPIGERSTSRPYTAQNVLATIYRHLGIDPAMTIRTTGGHIAPLLDERQVIEELI